MIAMPRPSSEPSDRGDLEPRDIGPTALRLMVGAQLRRLREERNISQEDAGYAIRASRMKIYRMEQGQVGFKERDLLDLLRLYRVQDEEVQDEILDLARQANTPGWWHEYGDVVEDWFRRHLGLEQEASLIRTYEVQFLPGLLQTEDYARAVTRLGYPNASQRKLDRLVELRMARQQLLTQPEPPRLWTVVDEATLRRAYGGTAVLRGQLEHLLRVIELPNVSVQVAPFAVANQAVANTPITLLRFDKRDMHEVVYLEQLIGAIYLDKSSQVDQYTMIWDRLVTFAQSPDCTAAFVKSLLDDMA